MFGDKGAIFSFMVYKTGIIISKYLSSKKPLSTPKVGNLFFDGVYKTGKSQRDFVPPKKTLHTPKVRNFSLSSFKACIKESAGVVQWVHPRLISKRPHRFRIKSCHMRYLGALSKIL